MGNGIEWLLGWLEIGQQPYESYELTEEDVSAIERAATSYREDGGVVIRTRPPRDGDGVDAAVDVLRAVHDVEVELGIRNESDHHAHELTSDGDRISFHWAAATLAAGERFERQLRSAYDGVTVEDTDRAFPRIEAGEYAAGATLGLAREFWYPLQSPLTAAVDGEAPTDPYGDVAADAASVDGGGTDDDCRVLVQTVFEPARDTWSVGGPWGHDVSVTAYELRESHQEQSLSGGVRTVEPTPRERKIGRLMAAQVGTQGYYVTMRVLAIAGDPETASRRARQIAADYEACTHPVTEQGVVPSPVDPAAVPGLLEDAAGRTHEVSSWDRVTRSNPKKFLVSAPELAALCHLPDGRIDAPAVDWANMDAGPGVPPGTTQMEDVAAGRAPDDGDARDRFRPVSAADRDVDLDLGDEDESDGLFGV